MYNLLLFHYHIIYNINVFFLFLTFGVQRNCGSTWINNPTDTKPCAAPLEEIYIDYR